MGCYYSTGRDTEKQVQSLKSTRAHHQPLRRTHINTVAAGVCLLSLHLPPVALTHTHTQAHILIIFTHPLGLTLVVAPVLSNQPFVVK